MKKDCPIVFIITGKPGSGKTTFLERLIERLRKHNLSISGFLAKRSSSVGLKQIYEIYSLDTGRSIPLASREVLKDWTKIDHFYFNQEALIRGNEVLKDPQILHKDLIVVDEIGIFELEGKIWADAVSRLIEQGTVSMIWVVRDSLVEKVKQRWDLKDPVTIDIEKVTVEEAFDRILKQF